MQIPLQNTVLEILVLLGPGATEAEPENTTALRPIQISDITVPGTTARDKGLSSEDILSVKVGGGGSIGERVSE